MIQPPACPPWQSDSGPAPLRNAARSYTTRWDMIAAYLGCTRLDGGPKFVAVTVTELDRRRGCQDGLRRAEHPVKKSYVESFNGKLWDELFDTEMSNTLAEARPLVGQ